MTVYGFNRGKAETLNRLASAISGKTNAGNQRGGEEALIVQVPAGETLAARVGADVGTLLCEIQQLGTDATLSDSGNTCLVYNKSDTAFQAGEYLDVIRQKSLWIALSGGGGGGSANYLCKAPVGGVPARSGSTASQTDCDIWSIDSSSGLMAVTANTVEVFNVWSQSIGSNAFFTAKSIDGVYVPDAEDCTGN
jgi:hypothetical protein